MAIFDRYAKDYKSHIKQASVLSLSRPDFFSRIKLDILQKAINSSQNNGRILDFGCGIGLNINSLEQRFDAAEVIGVDESEESLRFATKSHPGKRFLTNLSEVNKLGVKFNIIYCACVFHHIKVEERERYLTQLRGLLSQDGVIAIFEHNPFNPLTRLSVALCELDKGVSLLYQKNVTDMGINLGMTLLTSQYYLVFPEFLNSWEKSMPWLGKFPLGAQHFSLFKV